MSSAFFISGHPRFDRIFRFGYIVRLCSLVFFALAYLLPNPARAQNNKDGNRTSGLSPFEQAELLRLIDLDIRNLSKIPVQGVLGYDQEYWRNPASVHVIRPEDITLNGYLNSVEALRGVPGMHVTRGLAYDNFASMRNFSGFSTQKFLGKIGGREVSQLMLGSANYSVDDYPIAVIDRIEVIRGPGASIWGTNAVNGVINLVTKHSGDTQGDSFRMVMQDNGTFMGDYVHGGQISEDSFYRVWARNQEYAEGTLNSGLPARDDGYLRKTGFRIDKELGSDLNLYVAGGFATRRLEHVLDFSNRLFYLENSVGANPVPLAFAQQLSTLPVAHPSYVDPLTLPPPSSYSPAAATFWSSPNGLISYPSLPGGQISRYEYYDVMKNDSANLVGKLEGITNQDLEWSVTGFADYSDIYMGHLGFEWEQTQYDLSFDANRPVGDFHRLSFGLSAQRTELDVATRVIEPFQFGFPQVPILDYDQAYTSFDRFNAYLQDSITLSDQLLLSIGAKFEENDLAGFGFQPGMRTSWMANESNVFWAGYSKAHRQPSLRERYTTLTPYKVWSSSGGGAWFNQSYPGDSTLDREEMDAYELGWRVRPNKDLLVELSTYYYDTKNAVRAARNSAYEAKNAEAYGGELSVDWRVSGIWRLRGGYSQARGKVEGVRVYDFPENTASLSSHFKYSDQITLVQNLFYSGKTDIPSDYNPITIPSHLRLDLGVVWEPKEGWEIGVFGRDLLERHHLETMYPGVDVEPARVERTFLISITKDF
ncbi:MAG: TonB-dependent receptor [Opitutae bacterium]|nr:TonB-dependent receptor [Opitutae bacterium]